MTMEERKDVSMIDVGDKPTSTRIAVASGEIHLSKVTINKIKARDVEKGDVVTASMLVGITSAKKAADLLPLCHPLHLAQVSVEIHVHDTKVVVEATVKALERTGVEMEALAAVMGSLLNIWDMTKMYEKDKDGQYPATTIQNVRVVRKVKG